MGFLSYKVKVISGQIMDKWSFSVGGGILYYIRFEKKEVVV